MFERFTERARQVVVLAQDEARRLGHAYIGTEHLLLGLLREEEGLAARALAALDVELEAVRSQVARIVGTGDPPPPGQIPFTPRAKKVLELSLRQALELGHDWIGTEHLLLGLAQENAGVASRILLDAGVDGPLAREATLALMVGEEPPKRLPPDAAETLGGPRSRRLSPSLAAGAAGFAVGLLAGRLIWGRH